MLIDLIRELGLNYDPYNGYEDPETEDGETGDHTLDTIDCAGTISNAKLLDAARSLDNSILIALMSDGDCPPLVASKLVRSINKRLRGNSTHFGARFKELTLFEDGKKNRPTFWQT